MKSKIKYVKELPKINTTSDFIILESAKSNIGGDWRHYIDFILSQVEVKNENFRHTTTTLLKNQEGNGEIHIYNLSALGGTMLGTGGYFQVIKEENIEHKYVREPYFEYRYFGESEIGYAEFIEIYNDMINTKKDTKNKYQNIKKHTVDRFLAFQWSEGKLLYPIYYGSGNHHRHISWHTFIKSNSLSAMFEKWVDKNGKGYNSHLRKRNFNALLSSTSWQNFKKIEEKDIMQLQIYVYEKKNRYKIGKYLRVINDFRLFLIAQGNKNILTPIDAIKREKKAIKKDKNGNIIHFFDFVDIDKYPNLKLWVSYGNGYAKRLKADGLSTKTIKHSLRMAKKYILYIIEYYPTYKVDISLIEKTFNPNNPNNIVDVLSKSHHNGINYATPILNYIGKFLVHCELYNAKVMKAIPRRRKKPAIEPYRSAMPKEMVRHILDILKNRPPRTTTKWSKDKADISWWKHEEYPIFPLMMLFHYYIPLRGGQIRHLCRDASFVIKEGRLDKFIVNTDKNVNRAYLQEIPCVWEDLQIFVPFLKWHKEYFPNIPKIKYEDDDNSPWEDIEPLFVLPSSLKPISNNTHFLYHKRVLCIYQLEMKQRAEARGESTYPIVAWSKTDEPFFTSIEEVNNAKGYRFKDIGIMYDVHSLRVTGATRYLESGVGLNTVMELTGHMNAETLSRIYIRLTRKEKEVKLKSAIKNIFFGEQDELIQNTSDLIRGELTEAYSLGADTLETTLEKNALFSLHRKASFGDTKKLRKLELGTSILTQKHPTSWIPMIHGICPALKCPEGREHKCSLCPYLITGKLFMDGVVHQTNLAFADFQRQTLSLQEEEAKGYRNHSLAEGLETKLEEILGWKEILERIDKSLQDGDGDDNGDNSIVPVNKSAFGTENEETHLTYLKNAYSAQQLGVEQDRFGLKALTIKAIQMANKEGDNNKVTELIEDETKAIDMLMGYYKNQISTEKPNTEDVTKFITSLKMLPKPK